MANFLSKLFKPKWQSSSAPVRIAAINALDLAAKESIETLTTIINSDPSDKVKQTAIALYPDANGLIKLHPHLSDDNRTAAHKKLIELAQKQSLSIFELINDAQILQAMIVQSDDPEPFINGLARIEDQDVLLSIAIEGKTSKIRQMAAELIESESVLTSLSNKAKSKDKSVYQIARQKLAKLRELQKQLADQQQAIDETLAALEDHAATENTKLYKAKLESLSQKWQGIHAKANTDQQEKANKALQACNARVQAMLDEANKTQEAERLAEAGGNEQHATLLTLEDSLTHLREQGASFVDISAIDALIKTQENRWLEATKLSRTDKAQQKHYQLQMSALKHCLRALQTLSEEQENISELIRHLSAKQLETGTFKQAERSLNQVLKKIDWPEGFSAHELIQKANKALGISEVRKQALAQNAEELGVKFEQLLQDLDGALEDRQIKVSTKYMKQAQQILAKLPAKAAERLHANLNLRLKQLNELRDWQGFASSPRQAELCELMEHLAEQQIEPKAKAEKIKTMQAEWKSLGGTSEQALWDRFKAASDLAFEPCAAYFKEQNILKERNTDRREMLLTQLQEFVNQNNWEAPDWRAAEKINQKARSEWKAAFPVDFKRNHKLQDEFNTVLKTLETFLESERDKNLALKAEIVEQAKSLITHADLKSAIQNAKNLQNKWQTIGITAHKKDRVLWKEYRSACDAIFARRDEQKAEQNQAFTAAKDAAEAFCSELESFIKDTNNIALDDHIIRFRKGFRDLPTLANKDREKFQDRFEQAMHCLKAQANQAQSEAKLSQWQETARKHQILNLAYLNDEVDDALEDSFYSKVSLPSKLEQQLRSTWISIKAGSIAKSMILNEDKARELSIRAEIAAGIDSPENEQELRMQLQVSRLSEGISSSNNLSREEQLNNILEKWYCSIGLETDNLAQYERRMQTAVKQLFGH
jgi:hypothetical protein